MNDKFWLDGELFVRDLDATWSYASAGCFHQEFYFCPWQKVTLSVFFGPSFSFSSLKEKKTFFCFWFFHEQRFFQKERASTSEYCQLRNRKTCPKMCSCCENSPGSSPRCEIMTRSWVISFYLKIRFSKELGCFWRFDIFFFWNRYLKCSNSV